MEFIGFLNKIAQNSLGDAIKSFINSYLKMNVLTFVIHLVCAVIIIACIALWVWKPTCEFIAKNKKKLDSERMDLVVNTKETKYFLGLLKKERNAVFNIRRREEALARHEAEKIILQAKKEAEMDGEKARKEAIGRIRIMEENAKEQIKNSVVQVALELTEKLVGANINDANNQKIVEAYIKDLETKKIASTDVTK